LTKRFFLVYEKELKGGEGVRVVFGKNEVTEGRREDKNPLYRGEKKR
jgi:hypothetical protein